MAERVSSGQPIPRSAALWNNIIGAANEYAGRSAAWPSAAGGSGAPAAGVVKIKNSTAVHVRLGEVLEISGFLLTDVVRHYLWFDGASPDGTRPFAIAMQDIPPGTIDCAIVSGQCVARVNVSDSTHEYAKIVADEIMPQSAIDGPMRILYKPTDTGEQLCAVTFPAWRPGRLYLAKAVGAISARTGSTAGSGTVNVYRLDDGEMTAILDSEDAEVEMTVYNWSSASTAEDAWLIVCEDAYGTAWVVSEDCP